MSYSGEDSAPSERGVNEAPEASAYVVEGWDVGDWAEEAEK